MKGKILKNPTIGSALIMLNKSYCLLSILLFMFAFFPLCAQEGNDTVVGDNLILAVDNMQIDNSFQLPREANYDWISYRMKINAIINGGSQSFQVFFVNRIDSIIYLNASFLGIEMLRIVMTPDTFTLVDKINSQYYQGDFRFLSRWLGIPVSFNMFQAIFNALDFTEFEQNFQLVEQETGISYISPQRCHLVEEFCISQQIDLDNSAHILRNQLTIPQLNSSMIIFYEEYATQNIRDFFTLLKIEIPHLEISASTDIKSLKFNESGPTSIKIPSNFKPIEIPEKE